MTETTNDASSSAPGIDDQVYADHWRRRHEVYSLTLITARYHRKRQRFFDLLTKLTQASTVMLGASLLGATVKDHLPLVASAISGLGLLALVFGYGDRKQAHKELADSVSQLTARIEDIPFSKVTDDLLIGHRPTPVDARAKSGDVVDGDVGEDAHAAQQIQSCGRGVHARPEPPCSRPLHDCLSHLLKACHACASRRQKIFA